jgi:uncharacterized protein (TIGR02145 family)
MSYSPLKLALTAGFVLALTFTFSCSGDDSSNTPTPLRKEKISGVSQKGPFDKATVKIYRLDANKKKMGNPVEGKTDPKGKFEIEIEEAQYISIEVTGKYANEVVGGQSEIPITLNAIAKVSNKDININVFTHLEYERVLESTKAFDEAKKEAQNKVLGALGMSGINVNSESLSLFGNTPNDAKLLAASVLLQADRETGAVSNLLKDIGDKIKDGGDLSQQTKDELLEGAKWVKDNISRVGQNINNLDSTAQFSVDDINNIIAGIDDFSPPIDINSSSSIPSSSSSMKEDGSMTDIRDNKTYKTVVIGTQTWMAQNLNYNVSSSSKCYNNGENSCTQYGRLYTWAAAMSLDPNCNESSCASNISGKHRGICPEGWHIPSDADWNTLMKFVVDPSCSDNSDCANAGTKLKATNGWSQDGNGTDDFGFSALPGGIGYNGGSTFNDVGNAGIWWSASEKTINEAYYRGMSYSNGNAIYNYSGKDRLHSVRCLKD